MTRNYVAPTDLAVNPTTIDRVILVGNCIFDTWIDRIKAISPMTIVNHYLFHDVMHEKSRKGDCDFRIAQIPLRSVWPEYMSMPLSYDDIEGYEALFDYSSYIIRSHVEFINDNSLNAPTFFINYMVPQHATLGRLLPRYDLRNPVYFIEELNRVLDEVVRATSNHYILDVALIGGTLGRRSFQDDAFSITGHGGFISDYDWGLDNNRLLPGVPLSQLHAFSVGDAVETLWLEAIAMVRTLRATDRVKMVCVDLDDTLWRGILAERDEVDVTMVEGWPLGFAEALTVLKRRGVILTILSKNDEQRIVERWHSVFGERLKLEDFAIRKIGWKSKDETILEAIAEANILPNSVLFIDDNPVERARVASANSDIRVLGASHLDWRRILLWSPETQVERISHESAARNEMIKAQVLREESRKTITPQEFLESLDLKVEIRPICATTDMRFARALELINKTNQFNTSGVRWTEQEAESFFGEGGVWWTFTASDRFTQYGLIGVVMISHDRIVQMVMSCRVFGLGVEQAVIASLSQDRPLVAHIVETAKNGPCQSVFHDAGWTVDDGVWSSDGSRTVSPGHVVVSWA